jgi:trans-2,3-dihydro-3-hydroxyanthranilate isomerase
MTDYRNGREVDARMFAPALGIAEDPATGGAAAALAGFLADRQGLADGTTAWTIRQGFDMGRPSIIDLEADHSGGAISAVRVGGGAILVGRGSIDVP